MKIRKAIYIGLVSINGCFFNSEISTFNELAVMKESGKIIIIDTDSVVYYVNEFIYSDTSIGVSGTKTKLGYESEYSGELLFSNISYIQTNEASFLPALAFVGLNLFIIGDGVSMMTNPGIEPIIEILYPSGSGGSCPYVYSWNGKEYNLEGEAFGIALGKALETETSIVLKTIEPNNNKVKIKLTNERPETHFFNNIKLTAVESNENEKVYSNNNNAFFAVRNSKKITRAIDRNMLEITNLLIDNDEKYWRSDLSSASSKYDFEDQILVLLKNVNNSDSLSLIINAINTEISNTVMSYLQMILGDEFVGFMKLAESDPEIIDVLKDIVVRSSLKIDVWDNGEWKYIDLVYPEANFVEFDKLIRLPIIKNKENEMKIRLRCLSDVWKIDELIFDDEPNNKLTYYQPELISNNSGTSGNSRFLEQIDDLYIKLLPGEAINLEYESIKENSGKKINYILIVGGYLYEWIIDKRISIENNLYPFEQNSPKIQIVKETIKNLDTFLPIVYSRWKEVRKKYVFNEK